MRKITSHVVNPANDKLVISVLDEPGSGGACHLYSIEGFNTASNPSDPFVARYGKPSDHSTILFQNGPIKDSGVNGVTHEALLAILIDRLRSFQSGPFPSPFNDSALHYLTLALHHLNHRTMDRLARNVEGTTQA